MLISSAPNAGRVNEGGGAGVSSALSSSAINNAPPVFSNLMSEDRQFDRQFQVVDQDGKPVSDLEITLIAPNGQAAQLQTDGKGSTPNVPGVDGEHAELVLFDDERA